MRNVKMMQHGIENRRRMRALRGVLTMALVAISGATFFASRSVRADGAAAAFDLSGPRVEMKVMRAGKTLPIANVPNLQAGDRLWVHPDFPDSQSVHFLVVIAFLRGATNPPPENWFTKAEAWNKQVREEGFFVTVPQGAQQAPLDRFRRAGRISAVAQRLAKLAPIVLRPSPRRARHLGPPPLTSSSPDC